MTLECVDELPHPGGGKGRDDRVEVDDELRRYLDLMRQGRKRIKLDGVVAVPIRTAHARYAESPVASQSKSAPQGLLQTCFVSIWRSVESIEKA